MSNSDVNLGADRWYVTTLLIQLMCLLNGEKIKAIHYFFLIIKDFFVWVQIYSYKIELKIELL